ncbi:SET domain-containing protein-lysine N-methyltransferase [Candidatus Woesearchaeota archaeon]|nr:SET domain-containing protein-lysine N-methyltransferase [Candidatus Woesearchaeota archaeon]
MTVYIDAAPGKGRGMFAAKDFKEGEVIEVCPVIPVPKDQWEIMDTTVLSHYLFEWGENEDEVAVCLGYGSIYNHSHEPNAEFDTDIPAQTIVFTAIRNIKKGEEICTDYQWEVDDPSTPEWFKNGHKKNEGKEEEKKE